MTTVTIGVAGLKRRRAYATAVSAAKPVINEGIDSPSRSAIKRMFGNGYRRPLLWIERRRPQYGSLMNGLRRIGGPCRDRTYDQLIKSQLLYQLS